MTSNRATTILLVICGVLLLILLLASCGPRVYCVNEPIRDGHGGHIDQISCTSTAYPGRG